MKKGEKLVKCITTCKNYFHDGCLSLWLSSGHDTCPLCRAKWSQNENESNDLVVNILTTESIIETQIQNNLEPIYTVYKVTDDSITVSEYCKKMNIQYKNGSFYYESIKKEKDLDSKECIFMNEQTGNIHNNDNNNDIIFIQTKSPIRKLIKNQRIIYKNNN